MKEQARQKRFLAQSLPHALLWVSAGSVKWLRMFGKEALSPVQAIPGGPYQQGQMVRGAAAQPGLYIHRPVRYCSRSSSSFQPNSRSRRGVEQCALCRFRLVARDFPGIVCIGGSLRIGWRIREDPRSELDYSWWRGISCVIVLLTSRAICARLPSDLPVLGPGAG